MKKGITKDLLYLSIITLVLCLGGCGIPNFYVPDSSNYSIFRTENQIKLSGTLTDSSMIKSGFPKLILLYQIVPSGCSDAGFRSAVTSFNSEYCSTTNGKRISSDASFTTSYTNSSDTSLNGTYGLFAFSESKSSPEIIRYFEEANLSGSSSDITWNLDFTLDSDYSLKLTITDSNGATLDTFKLYRYNGRSFTQLDSIDNYASFFGSEVPSVFGLRSASAFDLRVYAVITAEFTDYNNVFNSAISSGTYATVSFQLQ